jgi:hypothetical protein
MPPKRAAAALMSLLHQRSRPDDVDDRREVFMHVPLKTNALELKLSPLNPWTDLLDATSEIIVDEVDENMDIYYSCPAQRLHSHYSVAGNWAIFKASSAGPRSPPPSAVGAASRGGGDPLIFSVEGDEDVQMVAVTAKVEP